MTSPLRPYATACVALAGAALIAVTPVGPPHVRVWPVQLVSNDTEIVDSPNHLAGLIVGGSGIPIPQLEGTYVQDANDLYIQRILPGADSEGVFTPEGASPIFSGVQSLPIGTSLTQDQYMLNTYITQNVDAGNTVAVYGESQSAMAASQVMTQLQQENVPADAVKFVLVGNVDNPDGGWGARFDTSFPAFTTSFDVSTPADTPYDTTIYIQEYDGFSDFPKYPLNILADLNADLGLLLVHPTYRELTPQELDDATKLPTTAGYDGDTSYYIIPESDTPHDMLPLVQPLTLIPVIGKPLADLLGPALTQMVNLGYDNPDNEGWDVGQANEPTGFGVGPSAAQITTAINNLGPAIQQGISAFDKDISAELSGPASLFTGSASDAGTSQLTSLLSSPTDLINTLTNAAGQLGALGTPMIQGLITLVTTVPQSVVTTFVGDLSNPLEAIAVAAGKGVAEIDLVGGIELFSTLETVENVLGEFGLSVPSL